MDRDADIFRRATSISGHATRALNSLADELRIVGLVSAAKLAQDVADQLAKLHHDLLATTQPIDIDPHLEVHLRLPWRAEPHASADALREIKRIGTSLLQLTPAEAQIVVYALMKAYLSPERKR